MTDGHCDHCGAACREDDAVRAHLRTASETNMAWSATWLDGRCPFCRERARIVAWLRDAGSQTIIADAIERGAHESTGG